jgi:hypothetical protein
MKYEQEILMRAMNYRDEDMVQSAHGPRKRLRRAVPWLISICLVAAVVWAFPYLRPLINTDLTLRGPTWNQNNGDGEAEVPNKPDPNTIRKQGETVTLGSHTGKLNRVTETAAVFTVTKTDSQPLYVMLYDRMGDALASTEPDYKEDGVIIRPHTIRLTVEGMEGVLYEIPSAPGTYEITVDFTSIRNGTYPMEEYLGMYAYVGEDREMIRALFSLEVIPEETGAAADGETDGASDTETALETASESDAEAE